MDRDRMNGQKTPGWITAIKVILAIVAAAVVIERLYDRFLKDKLNSLIEKKKEYRKEQRRKSWPSAKEDHSDGKNETSDPTETEVPPTDAGDAEADGTNEEVTEEPADKDAADTSVEEAQLEVLADDVIANNEDAVDPAVGQ